jgi:erythrin-vacuolar iron transport family protein
MTFELDFSTLTLQDALDVAVLIEKEAEERYTLFAAQLVKRYRGDAADFFTMMARNEQLHGVELAQRRQALFGDAPSRITENMIGYDIEAPEFEKPRRYMSVRHALEIAMESEIKAYNFYAQALPGIQDASVRKLIEELRDEEVEHQRLLNEQKAKYPDTMEPDLDPEEDEIASL